MTSSSVQLKRSTLEAQLSIPHTRGTSPSVSPSREHQRASSSNPLYQHRQSSANIVTSNNALLNDLETIDKLTEVRTEIGLARAFVRLSLEKKLLGNHLKQLLNEPELLRFAENI